MFTYPGIKSKLKDTQRGFRPGHNTTDQIFNFQQNFDKSWEYAKEGLQMFCRLRESTRPSLLKSFGQSPSLFLVNNGKRRKHMLV